MDKSVWQWMIAPFSVYRRVLFPGRARRKEFWWFALLQVLVYVPFYLLVFAMMPTQPEAAPSPPPTTFWLLYLVTLVMMLPSLWVSVRRLHDTNRRGWWLLLPTAVIFLAVIIGVAVFGGMAYANVMQSDNAAMIFLFGAGVAVLASYLLLLVWFCSRGTVGENRFGPDPLGE